MQIKLTLKIKNVCPLSGSISGEPSNNSASSYLKEGLK